jgi:hypothetical protein
MENDGSKTQVFWWSVNDVPIMDPPSLPGQGIDDRTDIQIASESDSGSDVASEDVILDYKIQTDLTILTYALNE